MKKISEYLEMLPEPYRSQALENYSNRYGGIIPDRVLPYSSPRDREFKYAVPNAIDEAMVWSETPQGHNYWYVISTQIRNGNIELGMSYSKYLKSGANGKKHNKI